MSRFLHHYKTQAKGSNKRRALRSAAGWTMGLCAALYCSWFLAFPGFSGRVGRALFEMMSGGAGWASYLLPFFLLNMLLVRFKAPETPGWITVSSGSALAMLACAAGIDLLGGKGGFLGAAAARALADRLGMFGALLACAATTLLCLHVLLDIRWAKAMAWLSSLVAEDYRGWINARQELAADLAKARAAGPALEAPAGPERVMGDTTKVVSPPRAAPRPAESGVGRETAKVGVMGDTTKVVSPGGFSLPSLDLLKAPAKDRDAGRPGEAEIAEAVRNLETTLKNFGIDARVTEYAPGPVITLFEVSPAAGVKVSSIVSLANDIALAMKARGIRIEAPIPGKAAVGIEVPNARPAQVVLREILESPGLGPGAPLLSFAVGLSADGAPLIADLQKMPHLLVAGATNSGKSVLMHSLILSILFRARPTEVKFLMIDPKRLELSFYNGIPHLFDPITPSENVSVITSAKEAAKSLQALVKVMEGRYVRFQAYGVRNIESFNREAAARGEPPAFFIVVVIDELADLMLVASDTVEDSIQRLAQMARAVGIHLVLATQRPSVDVITGVIKANLTSRIALQVITKIDSKVILDSSGAESLQGRGDLLYLAPGAQKPVRGQGAYVSEEEINRVVADLASKGRPAYPALDTMPAQGEADLASFGVTALEFSQTLKLVLERKRVSQDLLKSHFGSSARATNLLSILEVKGFIHKPEGSNRWEINFDLIAEHLRKNYPDAMEGGNQP